MRNILSFGQAVGEGEPGLMGKRRRPRPALLLAIIAAHLLVILWLVTSPADKAVSQRGGTVLALSSFSPERPPSQPPRPPVVRPLIKPVLIVPVPPPPAEIAASQAASAAVGVPGQCTLAADTQAAILRDPAAMAELASLPPGVRTEADAVMVWNGAWAELGAPAPAGVGQVAGQAAAQAAGQTGDALRKVIVGVVEAAPPACREGDVVGPAFITIPETGRTTFLVIGSGAWRWSELLAPATQCVASPFITCPDPAAHRPTF